MRYLNQPTDSRLSRPPLAAPRLAGARAVQAVADQDADQGNPPGQDICLVQRRNFPLTPAADYLATLIRRHCAYRNGAM